MIGDILLAIKEICTLCRYSVSKILCIHEYTYATRNIGTQALTMKTCKKCGRRKVVH